MSEKEIHAVTGALGCTGKYIAQRLLGGGFKLRTLTNSSLRANHLDKHIEVFPFNFEDFEKQAFLQNRERLGHWRAFQIQPLQIRQM